jgi:hypothetical protein
MEFQKFPVGGRYKFPEEPVAAFLDEQSGKAYAFLEGLHKPVQDRLKVEIDTAISKQLQL